MSSTADLAGPAGAGKAAPAAWGPFGDAEAHCLPFGSSKRKRRDVGVIEDIRSQKVLTRSSTAGPAEFIVVPDRGFVFLDQHDANTFVLTHIETRERCVLVGDVWELVYDADPDCRHGAVAGVVDGEPKSYSIGDLLKKKLVEANGIRYTLVPAKNPSEEPTLVHNEEEMLKHREASLTLTLAPFGAKFDCRVVAFRHARHCGQRLFWYYAELHRLCKIVVVCEVLEDVVEALRGALWARPGHHGRATLQVLGE